MDKERLAAPAARRWTSADDYVAALVWRSGIRRRRRSRGRTEPESPRALLSTVPFVALLAALAMLSVGIMLLAWPGREPQPQRQTKPPAAAQQEVSVRLGNQG